MFPRNLTRICNSLIINASKRTNCYKKIIWICTRNASISGKYSSEYVHNPGRISSRNLEFPKHLSNTSDGCEESGIDCEEELMDDLEQDIAENGSKFFHLKDLLYINTKDKTLLEMNACRGPDELFKVIEKSSAEFNQHHATQTVILLWSWKRYSDNNNLNYEIIHTPQFQSFLKVFRPLIPHMSYEEITCSLLYLQKLGVDASEKLMQELLCNFTNSLKQSNDEIPLTALSRFAVAVGNNKDIYPFLVSKDILPHALKYLEKDLHAEDIRLLTICLKHLSQLVTRDVLNSFKSKIEKSIENGIIASTDTRCILKLLHFLNFPHWSQENTRIIRSLLLLLNGEFGNLSVKELEIVVRVLQSQLEPATIIPALKDATNKLFNKCPAIATLDCLMYFIEPNRRQKLIVTAKKMVRTEGIAPHQQLHVFRILRSLKISSIALCNEYWSSVLDTIQNNPSEQDAYRLIRHSHRYMHFNNNLGGTYHHKALEKRLCELLTKEIKEGLGGIIPSKFVRCASFVIAYGGCTELEDEIPMYIVVKLEKMIGQFTALDCLQLSRGLQIALEMRFRNNTSWDAAKRIHRIGIILDVCAKRQLKAGVGLQELSYIIRSFINRKASRKTYLFQSLINRYKNSLTYLNSRLIRDITFNLNTSHYVIPEVYEKILEYIYNNREHVTGDTVEKILTCCYNVGYTPENMDILHWCDEIVKRDFHFMNSLSVVHACLALCYFKSLSEQLTNKVFTIDFIQQIEDEIQNCYSKETYPERILNQVMQLNRAVCLDYPEAQVPWFQQSYIEAQMSKQRHEQSKFHNDVKNFLLSIVKDESLLKFNHVTPYGYRIDFVVHLNRKKEFLPPPKDNTIEIQMSKIAILLHKLDSLYENKLTAMKGSELLKLRHLEILGYKVVYVNSNEWNAMYMSMPGAKMKYLKNLLQIQ